MGTLTDLPTPQVVVFADPYKICCICGGWVTGYREPYRGPHRLEPCGHASDYDSVCPSWSPVTGCDCAGQLGVIDHGLPPFVAAEGRVW